MAAKSRPLFDYVAHVQKGDGSITELAGSREDYSVRHVYQWLWEKATAMGGWLLAEAINEAEDQPEEMPEPSASTYQPEAPGETNPAIGDAMYWMEYKGDEYGGASRLVFKEANSGK